MRKKLNAQGYLCSDSGVWSKKEYTGIQYTDGASVEERIAQIVANASDLSVLSDELRSHCLDWPSTYHLSPNRANLLRPLKSRLYGASVLEIGSGCGAITRFLGENAQSVLALEGTLARANITRSRTRDLSNVEVVCEDFNSFYPEVKFDVVTLIGVLEYAAVFTNKAEPHAAMLAAVRSMLAPGGVLILAIENQLGLKYFAGAAEDHISVAGYGIEDQYKAGEPRTFGRSVLDDLLTEAGFAHRSFYAPFPDYKLPVSVVSERGFYADGFDPSPLAQLSVKRDPQLPQLLNFAPERVWPVLFENHIGLEFSNSFLICASLQTEKSSSENEILAWHFSTDRLEKFCKETQFRATGNHYSVHYELLARKQVDLASDHLELRLPDSAQYVAGRSLLDELQRLVSSPGWTGLDVGIVFRKFIAFLEQNYGLGSVQSSISSETLVAPGRCLDILPHNLIVDAEGALQVIDEEWVYHDKIPLPWLIFRSALALVRSVSRFGSSSCDIGASHYSFISAISESAGCPLTESQFLEYATLEEQLQEEISGVEFSISLSEQLKNTPLVVQTNSTEATKLYAWLLERRKEAEEATKHFDKILTAKDSELEKLRLEHSLKLEHLRHESEKDRRHLLTQLEASRNQLQTVLSSKSMLITKPVRAAGRLLRGKPLLRASERTQSKHSATMKDSQEPLLSSFSRNTIVVLPVYRDVEVTRQCLESALPDILVDENATLVIVNDASPDAGMEEMLQKAQTAHPTKIKLIDNEKNLGFVKSVNKGMRSDEDADVLLLNSDVILPRNWLSRMRTEAYAETTVATVTPLSNNTTICTFPEFLQDNEAPAGLNIEQIDAAFRQQWLDPIEAPTGIGFCMFIRRDAIDTVGYFDEQLFGRGYGEENDFCQRVLQRGLKNLITPNLYVFHKGGVSFGGEKQALVENAMKTIDKLYPSYHADIQGFISDDPIKESRITRLCLLIARTCTTKILHISHGIGGGVGQHIAELAHELRSTTFNLVLAPEGNGHYVRLTLGSTKASDSLLFNISQDPEGLLELLRSLKLSFIHYHHVLRLDENLVQLARHLELPYVITVHDFYLLSGNPTLTDENGQYEPGAGLRLVNPLYPLPENMQIDAWRDKFGKFFKNAKIVIFPSVSARSFFEGIYENPRAIVVPHLESARLPFKPIKTLTAKHRFRVAALGALSREKGADLLESLAVHAKKHGLPFDFVLIGYAYRPLNLVETTGPFAAEDLPELIREHQPDTCLFLARWPETYSYTLSYAMSAGLPIVAPDIGAFSERLDRYAQAELFDPSNSSHAILEALTSLVQRASATVSNDAGEKSLEPPAIGIAAEFYRNRYPTLGPQRGHPELGDIHLSPEWIRPSQGGLAKSRKEEILLLLWRVYRHKSMRWVDSVVSFQARRALKRKLSTKPMHEI